MFVWAERVEISRLNGSFLLASWGSSTSSLYLSPSMCRIEKVLNKNKRLTHTLSFSWMHDLLTYVSGSVYLKVVEITSLKNIKGRKFPCELVAQIFSIFFLSSFFYASFVAAFSCLFILPSTSSSNSKSFSCILCRRRRHWSCFACKQEKVFREFFCKIHEILFCFNKKKSRIENITRFFLPHLMKFLKWFLHIPRNNVLNHA